MLPFSDACERNKEPILAVLRASFAHAVRVLEIGSGTGQHAVYFAANLPHVHWYPTERLPHLPDLAARIAAEGGLNLNEPAQLDVHQALWPLESADAIFTANTLHIMPWDAVRHLFAGIGRVLSIGGTVVVYGPFRYHGEYTSDSNRAFDGMLRTRDPTSGLRDIEAVLKLAAGFGLELAADHDMPAFNRCLVLHKQPA
jgi:SAM-dependent methyltransferase